MSEVFIAGGLRTPFQKAFTGYKSLMAYQLGAAALKGILERYSLAPEQVDAVVMGTVVHNVSTSNVAREACIEAGLPFDIPAHTVTMACISANQAIAQGVELIRSGQAEVVIAGGTDSASDVPILFRKKMRQKLTAARKIKSLGGQLKFLASLRFADFKPQVPEIKEFSTGLTMGQDCDLMARRLGVKREDQDHYAVRSHHLAAQAIDNGHIGRERTAVTLPNGQSITEDNCVRGNSSMERLAKLKPVFYPNEGSLTAGNSSALTDGAALTLLVTAQKARELGLELQARVVDYCFVAQDPEKELLLGPVFASPKLLDRNQLSLADIQVFEFHEAFAAQILAVLQLLESDDFAKDRLNRETALGEIPMEKFNLWGGSLSLGHPFGATGSRIVNTAVSRLHAEQGRYALLAACAAGGLGHAMLLERDI